MGWALRFKPKELFKRKIMEQESKQDPDKI